MKYRIFSLLMIFAFSTSMSAIEIRGKRKKPSQGYAQQTVETPNVLDLKNKM